jgi:hypothetical protein
MTTDHRNPDNPDETGTDPVIPPADPEPLPEDPEALPTREGEETPGTESNAERPGDMPIDLA